MSDEELMLRYQRGDVAAFEALYSRFSPRLLGYLRNRCQRPLEREEVFQEVLLKLHRSRELYQERFPFLAWLFTIARSVLTDHFRRWGREVASSSMDVEAVGNSFAPAEPSREIPWEEISPQDRKLLEDRIVLEKSFQEIAERLGLSEVGVRKRLSRALQNLRKKISGVTA